MTVSVLLIAQAGAVVAAPAAPVDLHAAITKPCVQTSGEITVCAKSDDEVNRLRPLEADRFEPKPLRATTGFLGGTAGIETDSTTFGNGSVGKQAKVTLRFKL